MMWEGGADMGRYIKFWGEYVLEELGIALLVTVIYCVLGVVLGRMDWNGSALASVLAVMPSYFLFSALFVHCILTINSFRMYTPVMLSMGQTRRAALWQQLGTNSASMALILLAGWVLLVGAPKVFSYQTLLGENFGLLAGIELLLGGFSIFIGILVVRFGSKLGILVGMLSGAIFGGMSVTVIDLVKGDVNAMQIWVAVDVSTKVNVIFAVVGTVAYLLAEIFAVRMTRKIEAKL